MIRITCPCGQELQASDEHAGGRVRCPKCQTILNLPDSRAEGFMPSARVEGMRSGSAPEPAPPAESWDERPRRREEYGSDRNERDRNDRERYDRDRYEQEPRRRREEAPAEATSGKAVFAFVLGIVALLAAGVLGFVAPLWTAAIPAVLGLGNLVLAIGAISQVNRSQGRLAGFGLALTGLILGVVAIPVFLPGFLIQLGVQRVREAAARTQESNNLKMIGLGLHAHHDVYRALPLPGNPDPATGKPLLSWRVHILPYIEHADLYRQFNLKEPWDSPQNLPLAAKMPDIYRPIGKPAPANHTTYQLFVGPSTPFPVWPPKGPMPGLRGPTLMSFMDGTSNTFLVAESSNPVLWTKPEDIDYDPARPPALGWSIPDRFHVLLADGSTRTVRRDLRPDVLRLLIDPRDGNVIPWGEVDR
ncbi:MAG: DUF1559 domain-containing protein [Gemmataceae bacterium]